MYPVYSFTYEGEINMTRKTKVERTYHHQTYPIRNTMKNCSNSRKKMLKCKKKILEGIKLNVQTDPECSNNINMV
jgi:hypothetical protein